MCDIFPISKFNNKETTYNNSQTYPKSSRGKKESGEQKFTLRAYHLKGIPQS